MPQTNNKTRNLRIHWAWWLLGLALLLAWQYWPHDSAPSRAAKVASTSAPNRASAPIEAPAPSRAKSPAQPLPDSPLPEFLPAEARHTIELIQRGGPFPHRQDGSVFGNREGHLPRRSPGWYREYTVETPGLSHRGARRIVTGGNPPKTWHYTSDHYDSFRAFDPVTTSGD